MQLGGEDEIRIERNLTQPDPGQFRPDVSVKRSIDLHHIEKVRQVFQRMDLLAQYFRRIKHVVPIFIGPPGRADANMRHVWHRNGEVGGKGLFRE